MFSFFRVCWFGCVSNVPCKPAADGVCRPSLLPSWAARSKPRVTRALISTFPCATVPYRVQTFRPAPYRSRFVFPCLAVPLLPVPSRPVPCHTISCHVVRLSGVSCHVIPCCVMSSRAMSSLVKPSRAVPSRPMEVSFVRDLSYPIVPSCIVTYLPVPSHPVARPVNGCACALRRDNTLLRQAVDPRWLSLIHI